MPAANVTPAQKAAPPESRHAVVTRNWVVFSFWAVVIFLGFPTWLWTTSIHRARLPVDHMLEWADGRACKPTFPLQIAFDAPSLASKDSQKLLESTQQLLDNLNEFPSHRILLNAGRNVAASQSALSVNLVPEEGGTPRTKLRTHSSVLDVYYEPNKIGSSSDPLPTIIASTLRELFAEERASIAHLLSTGPEALREQVPGLSRILTPELKSKLEKRQNRAVQYSPTYHITLSLFTPSETPSSWDIESAIQAYLSPLLSSFKVSNFTIDTQIQLFSSFAHSFPEPEFDESQRIWALTQETLSGFINAAEWPLSPSIGPGQTLNFILYVPEATKSPLVVKDSHANSWIIPQWGGVYILNPASPLGTVPQVPSELSVQDIKPALLTFSRQLLSLLGAPESPAGSLDLQIRSLARSRAASLLLSASSTLGSMARLTSKLSQIPIPENVARTVDTTLEDLKQSCEALQNGDFERALEKARNADTLAEQAFFEKSMVGQVYFPDEHKVAVYLPMLAPVSVPLLTAAMRCIKMAAQSFSAKR